MTGFIKPNAVNLLDFQCKPIRGHAGGNIATGKMIENSLCFQVWANFCVFIRQTVILSNADNCHRSGCAKNNGFRPVVISQAGDKALFTSVLSTLSQISSHCFPQETLKTVSGGIFISKTTWVYINICQEDRRELVVCAHLYVAILTGWQLIACQTQMISHVKMLNKM